MARGARPPVARAKIWRLRVMEPPPQPGRPLWVNQSLLLSHRRTSQEEARPGIRGRRRSRGKNASWARSVHRFGPHARLRPSRRAARARRPRLHGLVEAQSRALCRVARASLARALCGPCSAWARAMEPSCPSSAISCRAWGSQNGQPPHHGVRDGALDVEHDGVADLDRQHPDVLMRLHRGQLAQSFVAPLSRPLLD